MQAYLWTMLVLTAFAAVSSLSGAIAGESSKPVEPRVRAVAGLINVGLLAWVAVLLFGGFS